MRQKGKVKWGKLKGQREDNQKVESQGVGQGATMDQSAGDLGNI